MAVPTGRNRDIAIATPLGEDKVVFESMRGEEHLSQLYEFTVVLLSDDLNLNGNKLLGENVTLRMQTFTPEGNESRFFNGYVTSFSQIPSSEEDRARYQIVLQPWLWFLTQTSDCRIYQELTIPAVIEEVFGDHGFSDYELQLTGSYQRLEYCVQYRETDFNFVARLMEQEGIYYYFKHDDGKHTLVLTDDKSTHTVIKNYDKVPYHVNDQNAPRNRDYIWDWVVTQSVQPGKYAVNSFDFKVPKSDLKAHDTILQEHAADDFEIYDYHGGYTKAAEGERYASLRMEGLASNFEVIEGAGNARGISSGALFELTNFPRKDQNREYLVLGVSHLISSNDYSSGGGIGESQYECSFKVMNAERIYRPGLITPKPEIRGPQTAMVVGSAGEEIHTDEHARVKVKFHWDRHADGDENSSCWIRVSHLAAGQNWGQVSLPRVGQEVIVEHLEGDPNRPIVTGRVYNGQNKPPYELPANKTMSTMKSNSSKGGAGFNEIRFEDKKGEEQVFVHAEKNLDIRIKNDKFQTIGNDVHLGVKNDSFEHVEHDRNETVDNDHHEEIGKDRHLRVQGLEAKAIASSQSLTVDGDVSEDFKSSNSRVVADDMYVKATNIVIEATTNITLKVGQSTIAISSSGVKIENSSGTIALEANNVNSKSSMNTKIEAGVKAEIKAAMAELNGSAMATIKGGMVKIN